MSKFNLAIFIVVLMFVSAASAQNLLKNPGFEEYADEETVSDFWRPDAPYKGEYFLKEDAVFSRSGSVCVGISQTGPEAHPAYTVLYQRDVKISGPKELIFSVWAKGRGELTMRFYLYSKGVFYVPQEGVKVAGEWMKVDSDEWKKYSVTISLPEKAVHPKTKELSGVDMIAPVFNVRGGPVWLDDAGLFIAGTEPGEEKKADFFRPGKSPLMTISKLAQAPEIDGILKENEWKDAAAVTGFFELGGPLAGRQTRVYASFDEENLYVAFRSEQRGRFYEGEKGRDIKLANQSEAVEIWLQPPGKGYYQILLVPAGGILDLSQNDGRNWDSGVRYASVVEDSGEMLGGIQTFDKKIWTGEAAIPFSGMGVAAPEDGSEWRINFCRDFSTDTGTRLDKDWTTWSSISGSFSSAAQFGYAIFKRKGPVLRLDNIGNPAEGHLSLAGRAGGGADVQIVMSAAGEKGKKIIEHFAKGDFAVDESFRIAGATDMELRVAAVLDGRPVGQMSVPFTALPSFRIKPMLLYSRKLVYIDIDASKVPGLPEEFIGKVEVNGSEDGRTLLTCEKNMGKGKEQERVEINIAGLKAGDYLLKGQILSAGNTIASTVEPLTIPEKPAWLGNTLGITDKAPPPWTPVEVRGNKVSVTQREYTLQDSGLPLQIRSLGRDILHRPARLAAVVNGKEEVFSFEPLKKTEQKDGAVVWNISGDSEHIALKGSLRMEFDGFALWSIELNPKSDFVLEALKLEFPLSADVALFARGKEPNRLTANLIQDIYTDDSSYDTEIILGNRKADYWGVNKYSRKGWLWTEEFLNEVWAGDDRIGLSLVAETDKNIIGKKYAEFITEKDEVMMRVNLVSEPFTMNKPLVYEYAYHAFPLRPEPKEFKRWLAGFIYNELSYSLFDTPEGKEYLDWLSVGQAYHMLSKSGYPEFLNPERSKEGLKKFSSHGVNVAHNLWPSAVAVNNPWYEFFKDEWKSVPSFGWSSPRSKLVTACLGSSSFRDYMVYAVDRMVNELGYGGIYTDVFIVCCNSELHGCGGTERTIPFWSIREAAKRMWVVLKTGEKERFHYSHTGEVSVLTSFFDVRTHAEHWALEKGDQYKRLSPASFRAQYAQNESGVPYTFYPLHHYPSYARHYGVAPASLNEIMMMCLAHRVLHAPEGKHDVPDILPVWKLFSQWWTSSEFIPYWRKDAPAATDSPQKVLASTYLKQGKALIVVSNWQYDEASVNVNIDWKKMGFGPKGVKAKVLEVGKSESEADLNKIALDIPARDYRVIIIE